MTNITKEEIRFFSQAIYYTRFKILPNRKEDLNHMKPTDESKEKLVQTEPKEEPNKIPEESEMELTDDQVNHIAGGEGDIKIKLPPL